MPRDLTHALLADDIGAQLPAEARACVQQNRAAYYMGAISHDSFLYGSDTKLSTKMHGGFGDDTREVVLTMLDDVRREKNPENKAREQAFVYGFLTHMAVDSVFHPFVYSLSGSQVPENNANEDGVKLAKTRHRYVETWLDVHFLKQKQRDLQKYAPFAAIVNDKENRRLLAGFFCRNYQQAYGINKDLTPVYNKSMDVQLFIGRVTKVQRLGKLLRRLDESLDGRLGMAVSGFYQQDRKIPAKITDFMSFQHPVTGKLVEATLTGLTEQAVVRGTQLVAAADKYMQTGDRAAFCQAVPNINLDTGVADTKLVDIKKARPADVEELKGTKLRAFAAKGFKVMTSGAKVVVADTRTKVVDNRPKVVDNRPKVVDNRPKVVDNRIKVVQIKPAHPEVRKYTNNTGAFQLVQRNRRDR